MSKHQRKPAQAQPISANPLFPAVVALWFGAAFGLGSLAVRPSLLEDLVLQSHIDLVIPAAAPPLGITARILLALVLAALGALLGIALARRLARPKVEERERKRGARDLSAPSPRLRNRDAHADAPARRPISAHEELGDERPGETAPLATGLLAGRRRSLAIAEDRPDFFPREAAPLPGLDPVQPLDLAALALPGDASPEPSAVIPEPAAPTPALDWTRPAPLAPAPDAAATLPQSMVPPAIDLAAEPAPVPVQAADHGDRQVFAGAPPAAPDAAPRQIFGVQTDGDHVPQDFVKAAGFQTSVFETAAPSPLFERLGEAAADAAPLHAIAAPSPVPEEPPAAAPAEAVSDAPLPSPSTLGMTDLAARLADSMRRRRERASAAAAPTAPAGPSPVVPEPSAAPIASFESPVPAMQTLPSAVAPPPEAAAPPPAPLAVPAAMRPLALDAFLEDDAGLADASLLPPRHIAMPAASVATPAPLAPEPETALADEAEIAAEPSLADAAEDNPYASLLAVTPQRQAHVRIDEPEPAVDAPIEPVVIFPGQTGQVVPLAPANGADAAEQGGFRRFDAPGSVGQGQPVAGGASTPLLPAEEAAQALRAALSNLQRMSGAA